MKMTVRRDCLAGFDEGMLKTYLDGELSEAWRDTVHAHVQDCASCTERLGRLRLDGALVHGRLQLLEAPSSDAAGAAAGWVRGGGTHATQPGVHWIRPPAGVVLAMAQRRPESRRDRLGQALAGWRGLLAPAWRPRPLAMGSAAAALLLVGVAFMQPAVQAVAQGVLQSFRVQRVQPVRLDATVMQALPVGDIESLFTAGTYTGPKEPKVRASTLRDAAAATGLTLRAPARLPADVKGPPAVYASEAIEFGVTYDGEKLATAAAEMGVRDPALQAQLRALNGLTVKGHIPAAAALIYGEPPAGGIGDAAATGAAARQRALEAATKSPVQGGANAAASVPPVLALIQLKVPSVDVPGNVNVDQLREQLLRSGAVPPALATQLLAIRDWKSTLPFPVMRGTTRDVPVDGTTATLITGEAPVPVLVWQKDGVLYVMGGPASEQALLDAARSLAPAR